MSKKIDSALKILQNNVKDYLDNLEALIEQNVNLVIKEINEEQLREWKSLCSSYENTREKILKIKRNNLLNN